MKGRIRQEYRAARQEYLNHLLGERNIAVMGCECCHRSSILKRRKDGLCLLLDPLQVDHVMPRSADPSRRNDITNFQILCYNCNRKKGSKHEKRIYKENPEQVGLLKRKVGYMSKLKFEPKSDKPDCPNFEKVVVDGIWSCKNFDQCKNAGKPCMQGSK